MFAHTGFCTCTWTSFRHKSCEKVFGLLSSHLVQDPVFGSCDGGVQDVDPGLLLLRTDGQEDQVRNLPRAGNTSSARLLE